MSERITDELREKAREYVEISGENEHVAQECVRPLTAREKGEASR